MKESDSKKELRKHDFVASLVLLGFGAWMLVQSVRMIFVDLPGVKRVGWFIAPGVFPFILSTGIVIMALSLMVTTLRESGGLDRTYLDKLRNVLASNAFWILLAEVGLLLLYIFVLLGRLHFAVATVIYLFSAMFVVRAAAWYTMAVISVAVSVGVTYLFGNLFRIPLP